METFSKQRIKTLLSGRLVCEQKVLLGGKLNCIPHRESESGIVGIAGIADIVRHPRDRKTFYHRGHRATQTKNIAEHTSLVVIEIPRCAGASFCRSAALRDGLRQQGVVLLLRLTHE
jgi:hypothetical protein